MFSAKNLKKISSFDNQSFVFDWTDSFCRACAKHRKFEAMYAEFSDLF